MYVILTPLQSIWPHPLHLPHQRIINRLFVIILLCHFTGTGKTACLSNVLEGSHDLIDSTHIVTVNCMSIKQPQAIYSRIACELLGSKVAKTKNTASLQNALVKHITTHKNMV